MESHFRAVDPAKFSALTSVSKVQVEKLKKLKPQQHLQVKDQCCGTTSQNAYITLGFERTMIF